MTDTRTPEIVEHASPLPFDAVLDRIVQTIAAHGLTIFARIDHAAAAREIGMALPPATVLIYGNPAGGTPIMRATPSAALDLPLRVLIRERPDGTAVIAFHPVAAMLQGAGVPADAAATLEPAQRILLAAITP